MFSAFVLGLLVIGAKAACIGSLENCTAISSHVVTIAESNDDFESNITCAATSLYISSATSTFGFVIESDLWYEDHVFSDSTIQFKASENGTDTAMVKIWIEEQGIQQTCGSLSNFSLHNETSVSWTIPNFVADSNYSTPDLSPLLNALTVCPTYVVFRFASFYGNETAEGTRKIVSYDSEANATRLTLNAACPSSTTGASPATDDSSSTTAGLSEGALTAIIVSASLAGVIGLVLVGVFAFRDRIPKPNM